MKTATIIAALLVSTSALATNPPKTPDPSSEATSTAVGVGVGVALSGSESHSVSLAGGGDASAAAIGKGGAADASATQEQSAESYSEGSSASSDNALSLTQNYKGVRNAPSVALGSVYPTAGCQGGMGIGGSGVNGSGLLNFSFTKKECETVVLAQNFASIGMPETSCDILKTTKAWKRAVKANPDIAASCEPKKPDPIVQVPINEEPRPYLVLPNPLDPRYMTREELQERDRRMIEKLSSK